MRYILVAVWLDLARRVFAGPLAGRGISIFDTSYIGNALETRAAAVASWEDLERVGYNTTALSLGTDAAARRPYSLVVHGTALVGYTVLSGAEQIGNVYKACHDKDNEDFGPNCVGAAIAIGGKYCLGIIAPLLGPQVATVLNQIQYILGFERDGDFGQGEVKRSCPAGQVTALDKRYDFGGENTNYGYHMTCKPTDCTNKPTHQPGYPNGVEAMRQAVLHQISVGDISNQFTLVQRGSNEVYARCEIYLSAYVGDDGGACPGYIDGDPHVCTVQV